MGIRNWLGRGEGTKPAAEAASASVEPEAATLPAAALVEPGDQPLSLAQRLEEAKQAHRRGQVEAAEAVYLAVLREQPDNADALHMVGVLALQRGQPELAEESFRQALERSRGEADYHNNLGNALSAQGRFAEALGCFKRAVELDPAHLSALVNQSTVALNLGDTAVAESSAQRVLQLVPDEPRALLNLGAALVESGRLQQAITTLRGAAGIHPRDVKLLLVLASAYEMFNELEDALEVIQAAEKLSPDNAPVIMTAGLVFRRLEYFEQAEEYLLRSLKLGLERDQQAEAYHQLGLTLDRLNSPDRALAAFASANALSSERVDGERINPDRFSAEVDALSAFFTADNVAKLAATAGDHEYSPVFFVGFPRSGTTLMEQILKAHSELVTTDEVSPLAAVVGELRREFGAYPQSLNQLTAEDWHRLRACFHQHCRESLGDLRGRILVDKLPLNIVHLGLAQALFPRAKIIVALRDPRDVCLSCYMQKFELNDAMAHFLALEDCVKTYDQVMSLAQQYRSVLTIALHQYRYEDLVADFEGTVTALLAFLGLDWDQTLNGYREQARSREITTPSYRDVVSPINDRAVARWQRYPELPGISQYLDPHIENMGYRGGQ